MATIFVLLWQGVAMPIILFLAGLQSIPNDILEAASIDGATSKQTFGRLNCPIYCQQSQWFYLGS